MNIFTTALIQPLANGLIVAYRILGENMGLAILGFGLFLRVVLNPLTKPYMESMKKMKDFAPQLEKLKKKHGGDKIKLAQAQSEFYKQKGINPGAGCLPYLLQIVVLIAFFNVFSRVLTPNGDIVARFNELLYEPLKFGAQEIINTRFLYLDVTKPDVINLASLPIPLPGPVLLLAALVQFISAKIMAPYVKAEEKAAKKTKEKSDDIQVAMQQSMIYTFPLMTIVIGMRFASGLALYWFLFSVYQAIQQYNSQGWGGLTPWIEKIGLLQSDARSNKNGRKKN
ncbi:YidC/Oxa1 family membrane protein insertase [Patescibacteria group bacterium]|nr:YidC/Oxa1 family membrane protein insertase [Patescibacteria group bacterium]MBU0776710.1 YidC/Oxa1 family membrane protein insertase [Patescibacteria group bacterium]MBU0846154.1 YidC/Oxa1 family membrane protein insertase [Patescibacteria group bacterium]MBU0922757.1 YidC/Oxa1 family membrane protein insertase [Patescibacteria group bacterium]MBU1066274.1 YidC/Oxa1 family membrane protein insertase [Patescibacteria group bacterium]